MTEVDWCTGFPENVHGADIAPCCREHDLAYETGAPKIPADIALGACVAAASNDVLVGVAVAVATIVLGPFFYVRAWLRRKKSSSTPKT